MQNPSEYAMGDVEKDYCIHCARPDGSMQSYEERLESCTQFIMKTQGLDSTAAKAAAQSMMSRLPAWQA